jgi:hypothetical protein
MPTYTENVKAGVSVITCDWCGTKVTAELRHERDHDEGRWPCANCGDAIFQTPDGLWVHVVAATDSVTPCPGAVQSTVRP